MSSSFQPFSSPYILTSTSSSCLDISYPCRLGESDAHTQNFIKSLSSPVLFSPMFPSTILTRVFIVIGNSSSTDSTSHVDPRRVTLLSSVASLSSLIKVLVISQSDSKHPQLVYFNSSLFTPTSRNTCSTICSFHSFQNMSYFCLLSFHTDSPLLKMSFLSRSNASFVKSSLSFGPS